MNILEEANGLINGDRQKDYGTALESFTRIARGWTEILGRTVTPDQVALCMVWLKVSRGVNNLATDQEIKRDTLVDIAGYAGVVEQIKKDREQMWSDVSDLIPTEQ